VLPLLVVIGVPFSARGLPVRGITGSPVPSEGVALPLQADAMTGKKGGPLASPAAYFPPELFRDLKIYTFENGSGGPSTQGWTTVDSTGFGDYAALVSGPTVLQEDPGYTNNTHFWAFFNGSPDNYACGGHPTQLAVRKSTSSTNYVKNYAVSPWIDLALDKDGVPVSPDFDNADVTIEVYRDLPLDNLVFYAFQVRFMASGTPTAWGTGGFIYFGAEKRWLTRRSQAFVIPAGATQIQVQVGAVDMYPQWGGIFGTGACHSHSPLIDNIHVRRTKGEFYYVTTTADNDLGSLRAAITQANQRPGDDAILFNIPGTGVQTIGIQSPLPPITGEVVIDGYSQPGATPNTNPVGSPFNGQIMIDIHGGFTGDGFVFQAPGTLRGLATHSFNGRDVVIQANSVVIEGNFIGMDPSGLVGAWSNQTGIWIQAGFFRVGGATPAARNVINEGLNSTLAIQLEGASSGQIIGNYIGTDPNLAYSAEWQNGILIENSSQGNTVGFSGDSPNLEEANIIGGNATGISIRGAVTLYNHVYGNSFRYNTAMAIDLGGDGRTPNDPGDFDSGPEFLENFPDVASATGTAIAGTMHGAPNSTMILSFYRSDGFPSPARAEVYLGAMSVNTNGSGDAPFNFTPAQPMPPAFITASAHDRFGNTSEISDAVLTANTPSGSNVLVNLVDDKGVLRGTATFGQVFSDNNTYVQNPFTPPVPISGTFSVGNPNDPATYFDVTTLADYGGGVDVCLFYDENNIPGPEANLVLVHYDGSAWVDVTTSRDTVNNKICGHVSSLSPFAIAVPVPTAVNDEPIPNRFALHANVPNPFNPITTIHYDVPRGGADVNITVYDVSGRLVRELVNEHRAPGNWTVTWNGEDNHGVRVASGVYFYRMRAGDFIETKKMVLLK
jgi:hypothetical protein